ncbi:MAG: hypothetical protein AAF212_11435 [Verrucomicrobiota bacterium]
MKILSAPRLPKVLCLLAISALAPFTNVNAQSSGASAQEKIELLASALRAREAGDLLAAKERLEELIRIAPNDPSVQSLLEKVNRDLGRGASGSGFVSNSVSGTSSPSGGGDDVDQLIREAELSQRTSVSSALSRLEEAMDLADSGAYAAAEAELNAIAASLTPGVLTQGAIREVEAARENVSKRLIESSIDGGDITTARSALSTHIASFGASAATVLLEERIAKMSSSVGSAALSEVSPEFVEEISVIEELMLKARIQFVNRDYDGASETLKDVEIIDPQNAAALRFQQIIAERKSEGLALARYRTRQEMINEVDEAWNRPRASVEGLSTDEPRREENQEILELLRNTMIPRISFNGQALSRVLQSLSELSLEYIAQVEGGLKGINFIPAYNVSQIDEPSVTLTVFNVSLERILSLISQQVNFEYVIEEDVVLMRPGTGPGITGGQLVTDFFPISRATVLRLTGVGRESAGISSSAVSDPFAPPTLPSIGSGSSGGEEEEKIKGFLERAGIPFEAVPGANLAFDGTQLIVTQSVQNLEGIRNILRRYDQTKQVEIEAKFLEVQQGALEELGFQWSIGADGLPTFDSSGNVNLDSTGAPILSYDKEFNVTPQTLANQFSVNPETTTTQVVTPTQSLSIVNNPPTIPNSLDFAADANPIAGIVGSIGSADVSVLINALERQSGSDLMSAPRLTVLSGKTAQITIAQELIYPESYGDIQATASGGGGGGNNNGGGGRSSIAITAGTPQDFNFRNVGVEMEVTPTVEDNDNISLLLEPKVTEFEGFVEYGGPSVAISGESTVTVPPGFYQPIFSTRSVRTEVTVFDGATVVIGGLVREEINFVEDKVPFLADIPIVGRLFRNEGETNLKRNLMIFVSANLISPGGSPSRQNYRGVESNSLFQNPVILTPGGSEERN